MNCKIEAKTIVNPTEELDKVIEALSNIFDFDELIIKENQVKVCGELSCLDNVKDSFEARKIRETARKILIKGLQNNHVHFKLSKQAAFAGKVNLLTDELSALGEIEIDVGCENPEEFVDWICSY